MTILQNFYYKAILLVSSRFMAIHPHLMLVLLSLGLTLFYQQTFWGKVLQIYPVEGHVGLLLGFFVILTAIHALLLSILDWPIVRKPLFFFIFMAAAAAKFFVDSYQTVIDDAMLHNVLQTDWRESKDLLSISMLLNMLAFGVVPCVMIGCFPWPSTINRTFIRNKIVFIAVLLSSIGLFFAMNSKTIIGFLREHKAVRTYTNPGQWIYSGGKILSHQFFSKGLKFQSLGSDAKMLVTSSSKPKLLIVVVGETARSDHFQLNGYHRPTTPKLVNQTVVSFRNVWSCGTSTAISVPCMFSHFTRDNYQEKVAQKTENVLDVVNRAGVSVLWRDNNSSSKGVADRLTYEDYRSPQTNPICTLECRDEGMIVGLDQWIAKQHGRSALIVLHQMGSHGPAYHKRYPDAFAKFQPYCQTSELNTCERQTIVNAYDNTILYTDAFLDQVINFLKNHRNQYDVGMLYVSDHGESLGENGIYLHGLPYFVAPEEQKHIPLIMWLDTDQSSGLLDKLRRKVDERIEHHHLFHSILGWFQIQTAVYQAAFDIFKY